MVKLANNATRNREMVWEDEGELQLAARSTKVMLRHDWAKYFHSQSMMPICHTGFNQCSTAAWSELEGSSFHIH